MAVIIKPFNFRQVDDKNDNDAIANSNLVNNFKPIIEDEYEITYSAEQLKDSEEDGYQRGVVDGINQGRQELYELNQKIDDTIDNILPNLNDLFKTFFEKIENSKNETSSLALEVGKKIAGQALQENPTAVIDDAISKCLNILFNEPKILIIVHETVADTLNQKIKNIAASSRFNGSITISGDPTIAVGDCKIQWQDGGAEISAQKRIEQIEEIINSIKKTE